MNLASSVIQLVDMKNSAAWKTSLCCLAFASSLMACAVQSAATKEVRPIIRQECENHCKTLDMELGAVVLMMEHAGCVCSPRAQRPVASQSGGASLAGNVTIAAVEAAAAAAANQHRQQQQQPLVTR